MEHRVIDQVTKKGPDPPQHLSEALTHYTAGALERRGKGEGGGASHRPPKWGGISVRINYSRAISDNSHGEDG